MSETSPRRLTRLQAAFHLRGVSREKLSDITRINENTIGSWVKNGTIPRSFNHLLAIGSQLGFAAEYLSAPDLVPSTTTPHFRSTRHFETQKLVANGEAYGVMVGDALTTLDIAFTSIERPVAEFLTRSRVEPFEAARALRRFAYVGDKPIANMWEFASRLGVVVVFGPKEHRQLDAYSLWVNDRPVVVLNSSEADLPRLRFDIAHEIAHIVLHTTISASGRRDIEEREADLFAGELLYPTSTKAERALAQATSHPGHWQKLMDIKESHGMSLAALIKQAELHELISPSTVRGWSTAYKNVGFRQNPEWSRPREEPIQNVLLDAARRSDPDHVIPNCLVKFGIPEDVASVLLSTAPTTVSLRLGGGENGFQPELDIGD